MLKKQKIVAKNTLFSKKHETRNRLILYISGVAIGLPLLFVNVYLQSQNTDVLGDSTRSIPTATQKSDGEFQNKLTCAMCVKAVHGNGIIVLYNSKNPAEAGAICLPKAALSGTITPFPRPSGVPTPTKTQNTPAASFKNMPYISCPMPSVTPTIRLTVTPQYRADRHPTGRPTGTPNR